MSNLVPIPTYLNEDLIREWFYAFGIYLIDIDHEDAKRAFICLSDDIALLNDVSEPSSRSYKDNNAAVIAFSDEVKHIRYPDIIEEILVNWPNLSDSATKEIEELLFNHDGENETKFEAISKIICRDLRLEYDDVVDVVKGILKKAIHFKNHSSSVILGEFNPKNNLIILYTKTIEDASKNSKNTLLQLFEEVFVHELFHWFNYLLMSVQNKETELIKRSDYTASVVKESLAAYFEYRYCLDHNIQPEFWEEILSNSVCAYPYSGAKYFVDWSHFKEVLSLTGSDLDFALRTLLNDNHQVFYSIKNL